MRCGVGEGLNIEVCGVVRAPALDDGAVQCRPAPAVRVRASSLRGGAVAGQTFRPAQGSNIHQPVSSPLSNDHHTVSQPLYSPQPSQLPRCALDPGNRPASRRASLVSANQKIPASPSSNVHTLSAEVGHKHQACLKQMVLILDGPLPS